MRNISAATWLVAFLALPLLVAFPPLALVVVAYLAVKAIRGRGNRLTDRVLALDPERKARHAEYERRLLAAQAARKAAHRRHR